MSALSYSFIDLSIKKYPEESVKLRAHPRHFSSTGVYANKDNDSFYEEMCHCYHK